MGRPLPTETGMSRRRATLWVLPFLALGFINLISLLGWGLEPLWAFAIAPPILFVTAIAWVAFRSGFVENRGGAAAPTPTVSSTGVTDDDSATAPSKANETESRQANERRSRDEQPTD